MGKDGLFVPAQGFTRRRLSVDAFRHIGEERVPDSVCLGDAVNARVAPTGSCGLHRVTVSSTTAPVAFRWKIASSMIGSRFGDSPLVYTSMTAYAEGLAWRLKRAVARLFDAVGEGGWSRLVRRASRTASWGLFIQTSVSRWTSPVDCCALIAPFAARMS